MKFRAAAAAAIFALSLVGLAVGGGSAGAGAWPGGNGKVIFKSGNDELWLVNPDGTGLHQLTPGSSNPDCTTADEEPEWSPDGSKIVFTRTNETGQDVWTMNADGSDQKQLTFTGDSPCNETTFSENPSWSPDGSKIIYTSDPLGGNEDLWIMNADGSGQTKFYGDSTHQESEAFFSPDGTKIVFQVEAHEGCGGTMWLMDPNGTNATQLLASSGECSFDENYSWSPDSQKITFTGGGHDTDCEDEVFIIDRTGANLLQLTDCVNTGPSEHPSFSPDGTKIVFANTDNEDAHDTIWTMDPDGGHATLLPTASLEDNGQPNWQPIVTPPTPPTPPVAPVTPAAMVVTPHFTG